MTHRGWRYEVWSGADATRLTIVRFLGQGRRWDRVDPDALSGFRACATEGQTLSEALLAAARSGFAQKAHLRAAMLALLWWRCCGGGILGSAHAAYPSDASLTARRHFRCRTKNPAAASPADCGTPVCPPMLAFSVFSWEPKASKRSRAACRSFPSSSHWSRTCSGIVT